MERMTSHGTWSLIVAILWLATLTGCGFSDAPKREYADVTGTITYQGEPVTMGTVMFQPASGAPVIGEIQGDGTYEIKAVVGPNEVMIFGGERLDPEEQAQRKADNSPPPENLLPAKYATPASGLTFEVVPGTNQADFYLE